MSKNLRVDRETMFNRMKNFSKRVNDFSAVVQNVGYYLTEKEYSDIVDQYDSLKFAMDGWFYQDLKGFVKWEEESGKQEDKIQVYSDGGCRVKNNVKGNKVSENDVCAWAYMVEEPDGERYFEAQSDRGKTNNAMEITALAYAMKHLIDEGYCQRKIEFFLDSEHVLNGVNKWRFNWRKRNWKKANKKPVANKEMWQAIDVMADKFTNAKYTWVRGHENNEGNNYVDQLLNMKMDELESMEVK